MVAPITGALPQGGTALPMAAGAPLLRLHRKAAQIGLATLTHSATGVILSSHAAGQEVVSPVVCTQARRLEAEDGRER